jgi:hypothetical protein
MTENKTMATKASAADFLRKRATGERLEDCKTLVKIFKAVTGRAPKMWGPTIVGFGSYHYVYASGREGDAPLMGFAPRKPEFVLYLAPYPGDRQLKKKLGKYRDGAGCLYFRRLADIDQTVLRKLAQASVEALSARYAGD